MNKCVSESSAYPRRLLGSWPGPYFFEAATVRRTTEGTQAITHTETRPARVLGGIATVGVLDVSLNQRYPFGKVRWE